MIEDEAEHQITCVEDYLNFLQQFDAYRNQVSFSTELNWLRFRL